MLVKDIFDGIIDQYHKFHYEVYRISLPPVWLKALCEECGGDRRFFDKYRGIPLGYSDQLMFYAKAVAYAEVPEPVVAVPAAPEPVSVTDNSEQEIEGVPASGAGERGPQPLSNPPKKKRGMPKGGWPKKDKGPAS